MLKGNLALLKGLQDLPAKADLRVHLVLLDVHTAESLLSRNAGDHVFRLLAGAGHNPGAVVLGRISVADVDGDSLLTDREDSVLMHHVESHVGQLPQLPVCNDVDSLGIVDDPRIRHQNAGHIGPVLVHIRMDRLRHDGAGDVRAAPGEGLHRPVRFRAVKARHHGAPAFREPGRERSVGSLPVKAAVLIEQHRFGGVHELKAQIGGHDDSVQILSPGRCVVPACLLPEIPLNGPELLVQAQRELQPGNDLLIPRLNGGKLLPELPSRLRQVITGIQHIRHLAVLLEPPSRRGRHHISPFRVAADDIPYLLELLRACQRTSSKFNHLSHLFHSSSPSFCPDFYARRTLLKTASPSCPHPARNSFSFIAPVKKPKSSSRPGTVTGLLPGKTS